MSAHIPSDLMETVRARAGGFCEYCQLPQSSQEATFHADHINPLAKGGETNYQNLAIACVTWATVAALGMNRPSLVLIRQGLVTLGLFPPNFPHVVDA